MKGGVSAGVICGSPRALAGSPATNTLVERMIASAPWEGAQPRTSKILRGLSMNPVGGSSYEEYTEWSFPS